MLRILGGGGIFLVLWLVAGPAPAQDDKDVKAILERALKAIGGEAKRAKLPALILKGKGKFYEDKMEIPFSGEWHYQGLDKARAMTEHVEMGVKIISIRVVSKDKGWVKLGENLQDMDKATLAEEREDLYVNHVTSLVPLKAKEFKLASLGEVKVDGKAALGISVTHKSYREIKLYFDKETALLVKLERKGKDPDSGKEYPEEQLFSGHQEVDGIKLAMKVQVKRRGKLEADLDITEARPHEKLDEKLFTKP